MPAPLCERVQTSAGSEAAFVFPARRGRIRLELTPTRIIATSAFGTVELPWKALAGVEISTLPGGRPDTYVLGITANRPGAAVWTRGAARRRGSIGSEDEYTRLLREARA